ncbi:MAG: alpha/beta hydrolase [Kiritimatiellae bacterium]|nr:alpha/beta hydrolase [Kiritimatiellia bacterium]
MTKQLHRIPGVLVELSARGQKRPLDGLLTQGAKQSDTLLLFVHGMGGNFYRSELRKQMLLQGPCAGIDVLSFNNRGHEDNVADEVFVDCRHDIDAAIEFGRKQGYRRFILLGHSTGCQKSRITNNFGSAKTFSRWFSPPSVTTTRLFGESPEHATRTGSPGHNTW